MPHTPFLELYAGSKIEFEAENNAYLRTVSMLSDKADAYGLPSVPEDLDEEQQGILQDLSPGINLRFQRPNSLNLGRLVFDLDSSAGLAKTCANFISLCQGDRGMCKNAPNRPLCYKGTAIHRIAKDFVMQGGDVTRNDGSGGESIYGGKFADSKEGLKKKPELGSLAMANSGKNSNTSQFFVVLTNNPSDLAKISGKYVVFGRVRSTEDSKAILQRLSALAGSDEKPVKPVWVEESGVLLEAE
ncbi:peptidyl-prolyl cis-trans isomerase, cyclophilin-type protein [Ceratobasidium sp. AG-Ba]|nr:peptidyl-prolyl cis-trans isomerase, cyclophilin-type protein [Ceratobasidium sp. AG-Ba]QRW14015.1 peptidyl-prolyl cis-trans isomerase, cyclophilin-type protein [Ceratobasidium sp. AG-Ba]